MRANSLALRLFLSATAWAVVILLITGIVLSSLYRQAVERAFDAPATSYVVVLDKTGKVVYTGLGGKQNLDAAIQKAL